MSRYEFKLPDRDEPAFPGEAPSIAEALGHTVMAFEALDEQLSTAISFLLRRTEDVGRIVSADLSFRAKVNLFSVLFQQEAPSGSIELLHDLVKACDLIAEIRNRVVHSKWMREIDGEGMTRYKWTARAKRGLWRESESLSPVQVQALAHHCHFLAHSVDELMFMDFGEHYGQL